MKTLTLEVEFTYDDELVHSGDKDKDAKDWFIDEVLGGELILKDLSEIGDDIGFIKVLGVTGER